MFGKIKWGIHPEGNKSRTAGIPIERMPTPKSVIIPVRQHIGAPATVIVSKGDAVKKGQLIAEATTHVSSNVHSSISGVVKEIDHKLHPIYGECLSVVIENDGHDQWLENLRQDRNWTLLENSEILEIIKGAGIVGMGGAAFPSHVKLVPPPDKKIDTLVINAAECEPFLTVDHRMMLESPDEIAQGVHIIAKLLKVENVVIGIEDNKMDAVKVMKKAFEGTKIKVVSIVTRYPQGAEKMIIKSLLNREVGPGKLPMDVGVVVQNVSTAVAIYNAVVKGIPLIERVVTVSGGAIKNPKNIIVPIGTTFIDVIHYCEGYRNSPEKIIMGGPMMGIAQFTTEIPIIKGTSGILALSKRDLNFRLEAACIRCGKCVSSCPMGLNPSMISILGEKEMFEEAVTDYHLLNCIECGCCSYVCPAKRNIVHYVKYSKKMWMDKQAVAKKSVK